MSMTNVPYANITAKIAATVSQGLNAETRSGAICWYHFTASSTSYRVCATNSASPMDPTAMQS